MEKSFKRFLSLAMAFLLVLSNVPVQAFATDGGVPECAEHSYGVTFITAEATCTDAGSQYQACTVCGHESDAEEIPALGHSYTDGVCSVCGEADPDYVAPVPLTVEEETPAEEEASNQISASSEQSTLLTEEQPDAQSEESVYWVQGLGPDVPMTKNADGSWTATINDVTLPVETFSVISGTSTDLLDNTRVQYTGTVLKEKAGVYNVSIVFDGNFYVTVEEVIVKDNCIDTAEELQAALNEGGEVVLRGDISDTLDQLSYKVPEGVTVTLDLNGHTLSCNTKDNQYIGILENHGGNLTIKDSQGSGSIKNTWGTGSAVRINAGNLIIEGGSFGDEDQHSLYRAGGTVTIKGGTFNCMIEAADEAIIENGIFNSGVKAEAISGGYFANAKSVQVTAKSVTGGTFKGDLDTNYLADDYKLVNNNDGTYTVQKINYVAEVNGTKYESLQEAVDEVVDGGTVTLLATGKGPGVVIDGKSVTIDFNECTYTLTEGVGSTGTKSNGFQILRKAGDDGKPTNNVTLKNGTLNVAEEAAGNFYILIQNYANLTVENMKLDGTNLDKWSKVEDNWDSYVLSNNSGNVVIKGETDITANNDGEKAFAFDVCEKSPYTVPTVTVETTGRIEGKIEVSEGLDANLTIKAGGTYTVDPSNWTEDGYEGSYNSAGYWTIVEKAQTTVTVYFDNSSANWSQVIAFYAVGEEFSLANMGVGYMTKGENNLYFLEIDTTEKKYDTIGFAGEMPSGITMPEEYAGPFTIKNGEIYKYEVLMTIPLLQAAIDAAAETEDTSDDVIVVNNVIAASGTAVLDLKGLTVKLPGIMTVPGTDLTVKNGTLVGTDAGYSVIDVRGGNLVLEDVTASGLRHAIHVAVGTATIKSGTYSATNESTYAIDVGDTNTNATVTIEGGSFSNFGIHDGSELIIKGGTFNQNPSTFVAEGYKATEKDGVWTVAEEVVKTPVAQIEGGKSYTSLQDAIDKAQDKDTIKLLSDINIADVEIQTLGGKYNTLFRVTGKTVTINMNEKKISGAYAGDSMLVGVFSTEDAGHLTLTGNGTIDVTATATVYGLLVSYDETASLTVENGTYKLDKASDSLIYTGGDENVTINGGTFTLDNIGTGSNGSPWIFNAGGQNTANIIVNGGTFNADVAHQFYPFEVAMPKEKALQNNENLWTVVDAVAYVNEQEWSSAWYTNEVGYATLAEALNAAEPAQTKNNQTSAEEVVTLLKDAEVTGTVAVKEGTSLACGDYKVVLANENATLTAAEGLNVTTNVAGGKVVYENGIYKVAEVKPVAQVGETTYTSLAEAVAAANAIDGGATVTLLADATIDAVVEVTGNVTIDGADKTITWAEGYTGTLFNVAEVASSLTTKNLTIDGENGFTFYNDTTPVENGQNWYTRFVDVGEEDKAVNANVIVNAGNLTLGINTKIQNVTIASDGENGKTENTETGYVLKYNDDLAIIKSNGGKVTFRNADISYNAGLVVNAVNAETRTFNTSINYNMGCGNKGGIIIANGGNMGLDFTELHWNKAMARSATILGVINGAEVDLNQTFIERNKHIGVGSNTAGAMVVLEGASRFEMFGGTIAHNVGGRAGAIASRWVGGSYGQHEDTSIVLNAGTITENTASNDSWDGASIFLRSPATIGKDMKIDGGIAVNQAPGELAITGGELNGSLTVADGLKAEITGGTFNYDPTAWVPSGYKVVKSENVWTVSEWNYEIHDKDDLLFFAEIGKSGDDFSGKTVKLMADVDFGWGEWYPFSFYGTFEGNDHTISNLTYVPNDGGRMGFFQSIGGSAKGLTLDGIKGTVPANGRFGGFARYLNSAVEDIHVKNIEVTTTDTLAWVGGFTTYSAGGSTTDCSVENLTVNAQAGADLIAGFISLTSNRQLYKNSDVKGFKVTVNDTDSSGCGVGGFAAQTQTGWNNPKFEDCDISGIDVTATGLVEVGGFIAWPGAHTEYANNCTTEGKIDVTGVTTESNFAGGFFGHLGWNCDLGMMGHVVNNCSANVDIITKVASAGGFVGSATNSNTNSMYATFNSCAASGDITCVEGGTAPVGGFAGNADRGVYNKCSATGTVTNFGTGAAGGFIGEVLDTTPKYDGRYPAGTRDYLVDVFTFDTCSGSAEPFIGKVAASKPASELINKASYVAQVGESYYATFDAALAAAKVSEGKSMTLLVNVEFNVDTTLDLEGVTINGMLVNNANMTVKATNGGKIDGGNQVAIDNYGTLTIEGGTFTGAVSAIYNNELESGQATVIIDGGEFTAPGDYYATIENRYGILTVNGGTITATNSAGYAIVDTCGVTTINNGQIASAQGTAVETYGGEITIIDGEFTGKVIVENQAGKVEVKGGKLVSNTPEYYYGLTIANGGTTTLYGGTFERDYKTTEGTSVKIADGYMSVANDDGTYTVKRDWNLEIHNVEDLLYFADMANSGNNFSGKTIKLMADIDLGRATWTPIKNFLGTFDGGTHTISNFHLDATKGHAGFFYKLDFGNGTAVKDLTLSDITATVGNYYVGALAYFSFAVQDNITIKNFTVTTTSSEANIGGYAGWVEWGHIRNCTIENMTVNAENGAGLIGGLAAVLKADNWLQYNNIDVKGFKVTINDTDGKYAEVGGLVGQTQTGHDAPVFTNCDITDIDVTATGLVTVGGLVARPGAHTTATNCTTEGKIDVTGVTSAKESAGGFFGNLGWNNNESSRGGHKLTNCSADVDITTKTAPAGGFVGAATNEQNRNMAVVFNGCSAKGTITLVESGTAHIGGFAGEADRGTYKNCTAAQEPFIGYVYAGKTLVNENSYVAQVGNAYYATFDAALAAAKASEVKTMTLLAPVVLTEDKTLDLTGVTINGDVFPAFRIQNGANVTVEGGTVTNGDYVFVLGASDGSSAGYLTIKSGSYTGETTVASVTKGALTVEGGEFKVTGDYGTTYLLNCIDANYADGSAKIEVKGGRFHGFNPANNAAEGEGTNFVPMGYRASIYGRIDDVDVYDVVVLKATVEAGGYTYYYPGVENVDSVQELTNYYFLMQKAMGWVLGYNYEPVLTLYSELEGEVLLGNTPSDDTTVTLPETVTWTIKTNGFDTSKIKAADGYIKETADNGATYIVRKANYVAQIGENKYESLADAIKDANANDTIILLANITEDVTVDESVTIDGAQKEYTGKIIVSGNVDVTLQNVVFVKGYIEHSSSNNTGNLTVKGCSFADGGYAVTTSRISSVTIEDCTVTNQSLLYAKLSTLNVVVKDVTISGGNYVAHLVYGNTAYFENVTATNMTGYGIFTQNYGAKTITLKNCSFETTNYPAIAVGVKKTAVDTFVFEGNNKMSTLRESEYAKYELAKDATLTAPEGYEVTTNVEGHGVIYKNGTYVVAPFIAQVGDTKYASLTDALNACTNGETVKLIADVTYTEDDVVNAIGGATGYGQYPNPSIVYIGGTKGATDAENQPSKVNAVLDLNGYTITNNTEAYMFLIMDNAKLTVKDSGNGNGIIGGTMPVIWSAGTDTVVTIESGKYSVGESGNLMWATHSGDLVIKGGEFSTTADDASSLIKRNEHDRQNSQYFISGKSTVTVTGGTFHGFNPEKMLDDSKSPAFEFNAVAEGFVAVEKDGVYTIEVKTNVTIGSVEELIAFGNAVTGNTKYQGVMVAANPDAVVTLTADLDLTGSAFAPIGNGAGNAFSGTFDGGNHTISNMTLSCDYYRAVGFFRSLAKGAVVKNLTFENANINNGAANGGNHFYGVVAGFSNGLTLDNVDVKNSSVTCKYAGAAMVGCLEGATVIKNCDIENVALKTTSIRGAVYGILGNSETGHTAELENNTITNVNFLVDDEYKTVKETLKYNEWATGTEYTESTYVAQIGDTKYSTLYDAVAAAKDDDTITLIGDVKRAASLIVDENVTIDLNGKTVSVDENVVNAPVIRVLADVTVKGGTVDGTNGSSSYAFIVGNNDTAGTLTITDGIYKGRVSAVSITKGTANISGGYFEATEYNGAHEFTLNCIDTAYNADEAVYNITGGKFYKFNPENNAAEGAGTNFLKAPYVAVEENGVYEVVDYIKWIKAELLAGRDVKLERDIVVDGSMIESIPASTNGNGKYPNYAIFTVIGDEVTFDLNGHTITYNGHKDFQWNGKTYNSCTVAHGLFYANAGAHLTVTDSSAAKTGTVMVYGLASGAYVASNDTKFTIEGGTWINKGCAECGGTNIFLYPLQGGELYITGGRFEQDLDSEGESYLLVEYGGEYKNSVIDYSKTKIEISGGTFVGMNPEEAKYFQQTADNKLVTGETKNVCAEGFASVQNTDGSYTVKPVVTVTFDDQTAFFGYALPEFTYTTNFTEISEDGEMLVVENPVVDVTATGEYEITAKAYVFMSDKYVVQVNPGKLTVVNAMAAIGETKYETLAEAIAKVQNGETITLLADNDEDVTIKQTKDLSFIIDGAQKTYTGTITVDGGRRSTGAETLTIRNVNFKADKASQIFVEAKSGTYAHNITVDGCTFTGDDAKTAYGLKIPNSYNITVKNSTGTKLLDLAYSNKAVTGFTAENVTVTDSVNGFYMSYVINASFKKLNLDVSNIGVYVNNYNASAATVENCAIKAKNPVVLEQKSATKAYTLTFNGKNQFIATNEQQNWLTVVGTDAMLKVVINDTALDMNKTSGLAASIGNVYYNTLANAIQDAKDGDTIVILKDIDLATLKTNTLADGKYNSYFVVSGKTVTVDLNGKTISGVYSGDESETGLVGVFSTEKNGHLTLTGNGTIDVTADSTVYGLIVNYEPGCTITIENGTYTLDKATDSLLYTGGNEGIIVNGGTFTLDNVGTGSNGIPWIFNAKGQNTAHVLVNGGTFNADVNHQYWAHEVELPDTKALKNNGDGTWTVVDAVAYVVENAHGYDRNVGYATVQEAINAAKETQHVVLLTNVTENIAVDKKIILEGGEFTLDGTISGTATKFIASGTFTDMAAMDKDVVVEGSYAKDNGNNTWTVEVLSDMVAQNQQTGKYYNDVQVALNEAGNGETVILLKNAESAMVVVPADITLDLNGCDYTTYILVSFGDIIDGEEGGHGTLKATGKLVLDTDNNAGFLPIGIGANTYEFYAYRLENAGAKENAGGAKFGHRILFTNAQGYERLKNTEVSGIRLYADIKWDRMDSDQVAECTILPTTLMNYCNDIVTKPRSVFSIKVSGLDQLEAGQKIYSSFAVESDVTGYSFMGEAVSYTVQ